jgi:protein-L-isoaspartate(D-aspartate) O-methyltransferase
MDFARARHFMVESQVRTADVTDPALLAALRALPRERFAPAHKKALAYGDLDLEVAPGRTLLRPRDLAKLIQALAPQPGARALEIAGATGYGAAVLGACVREVVTADPDDALTFAAQAALDSCGAANVKAVTSAAADGWAQGAPYDLMLLNGGAEFVPDAWLAQLAPGGRLGVIIRYGPAGAARIYTRTQDSTAYRMAFDAAPPLAPGLARAPAFSF